MSDEPKPPSETDDNPATPEEPRGDEAGAGVSEAPPEPEPVAVEVAAVTQRPATRRADGVDAELRALGVDELPSMPPDAQVVTRRRRGWGGPA